MLSVKLHEGGKIHKGIFLCTSTQHSCYVCHKTTESGVIHPHLTLTLPYASVYPHTHSHNPPTTHVCTHTCMHTHTRAHTYMYMCAHTHACTNMQTHAHTHICTHTCRLTIHCMVLDNPRWPPHRSSACVTTKDPIVHVCTNKGWGVFVDKSYCCADCWDGTFLALYRHWVVKWYTQKFIHSWVGGHVEGIGYTQVHTCTLVNKHTPSFICANMHNGALSSHTCTGTDHALLLCGGHLG